MTADHNPPRVPGLGELCEQLRIVRELQRGRAHRPDQPASATITLDAAEHLLAVAEAAAARAKARHRYVTSTGPANDDERRLADYRDAHDAEDEALRAAGWAGGGT